MALRTFVSFNVDDDVVSGNQTTVTTGLWSGDFGSLTTFFSSSAQISSSGEYYIDVYDKNPLTDNTAEIQFAVAYGHVDGGGSPTLAQDDLAVLATKATYLQYKNILLDISDDLFTFVGGDAPRHIYALNVQRSRLREQLDPGNWLLTLSGSNSTFTFIDDSGQTLSARSATSRSGRVFNVVSGSLTGPDGSTVFSSASSDGKGFGLVYPDLGIIILNPDAIIPTVGFESASGATGAGTEEDFYYDTVDRLVPFAPYTGSLTGAGREQINHDGLVRSIVLGGDFQARSAETISSTHFFVRLRNRDFNYSNNPTFYNNTNGQILVEEFVDDPRVYVTSIGMYNDNNELLAVAKLSKPLEKSFDKEALVRVRLDF
jgi:hypothetical protein